MKKIITMIFLTILSEIVFAQESWDYAEQQKNKCSGGSMLDMNLCLREEYKASDNKLNDLYKSLVSVLIYPELIKKSQLAWLKFRDATCEYKSSGVNKEGSLYPHTYNACLIDLTEKRIKDLESYLELECNGCPARKVE